MDSVKQRKSMFKDSTKQRNEEYIYIYILRLVTEMVELDFPSPLNLHSNLTFLPDPSDNYGL